MLKKVKKTEYFLKPAIGVYAWVHHYDYRQWTILDLHGCLNYINLYESKVERSERGSWKIRGFIVSSGS